MKFSNIIINLKLKICLSEEQLNSEVIKKKVHLKTYLLLMFADKYPNLKFSYDTLANIQGRYEEYIQHKKHQSTNMREKKQ